MLEQAVAHSRSLYGERPHEGLAHALVMAAIAHWRAGDLVQAEERASQSAALLQHIPAEDSGNMGEWLPEMLVALRMERGLVAPPAERSYELSCEDLEQRSFVAIRLCLVRAWEDARHGGCALPRATPPQQPDDADRLWWGVYRLLEARCAASAEQRAHAADDAERLLAPLPAPPSWIRVALP